MSEAKIHMPHPSKRDLDTELKKIFSYRKIGESDLGKIDMADKGTAWKKLAILFFVSGFLLSLIWGGFLLLGRGSQSRDDIKIIIAGPKELEPMKEYDFTATLENVGTFDLTRVSFELNLPDQFFLTSSDPVFDNRHTLNIGNLFKKEKREIKFKGSFIAKEKEQVSLSATAVYHPQSFNATFEAIESYTATMGEGLLSGSIEGPDKLLSGDQAEFRIFFAKKEEANVADAVISVDAPSDFSITTSTIQPIREKIWPITFASQKNEGQAVFKGVFSSEASGDRTVKFLLGQMRDNKFYPTKELVVPIEVLGAELRIDASLNGTAFKDLGDQTFMRFGDLLGYSIDVVNTSSEILKNAKVIFHAIGEPQVNGETVVLWPTAVASPDATREDSSVVWTSREVDSFKNFKPSASEHLEGNVRLRPNPFGVSLNDYRIRVWVEVQLDGVGKIVKKRMLTSKVVQVLVQSDTDFDAEARYYGNDGVALSTGSLPPKVGEQTTYRIFWKMNNSLHELKDIIVRTTLASNVVLTGKNLIPSGIFSYDGASRTVTWSLDSWSIGSKNIEINFEVGLTPVAGDAGKSPELLGPASFKATDVATGADINLASPTLTTNIKNDSLAGNKTVVIP